MPNPAPPRWSEVVAIFGGTFDPPHLGHREALNGLFSGELGIGRALIVPAASPPHKPTVASPADRLALARLAFAPEKLAGPVEISEIELTRAEVGGGGASERPSYSYDTISALQPIAGGPARLAFVLGADQLSRMATRPRGPGQGSSGQGTSGWYRFPEILGLCHWIVLARRPDGAKQIAQTLSEWNASGIARPTAASGAIGASPSTWVLPGGRTLKAIATDAREVSSTAIREEISRTGQPPANALDPDVEAYLRRRCIYGMTSPNGRNN